MRLPTIAVAAILILLVGCTAPAQDSGKLKVITTVFPLYEFVKEVGGDRIEITLILPPGVEPHTYDPRPSDIQNLAKANLVVYVGKGMEPWFSRIITGLDRKDLAELEAGSYASLSDRVKDPHFWLDFKNDPVVIDAIATKLASLDPKDEEYFIANAQFYKEKLLKLDSEYRSGLADCSRREFITGGHEAFGYLAERYNLTEIAVYGVSPDSEPTPKKMQELFRVANDHNIKYVFFESLIDPRIADTIAQEIKGGTIVLDPGDNLASAQWQSKTTFISLMESNLVSLKKGLECR
jgi:zinc transport system substrate-binding protein